MKHGKPGRFLPGRLAGALLAGASAFGGAPSAAAFLPLSDGSGGYSVPPYENVSGDRYSKNQSKKVPVDLEDELGRSCAPTSTWIRRAAANTSSEERSSMQAIYKNIPPKQGQPQQEPREMNVTAHYDFPVVPGNVNRFSDAPCPEGCTQAVAYSMGRGPRGGDRT